MKKILLAIVSLAMVSVLQAQNKDEKKKTDWSKIDLSNRANDHLMMQYGYDGWSNAPDSAKPKGFSRHFNIYIMYDKPFKGNPHFSVGIGVGVGSSNIFFQNKYVDLKSTTGTLPFKDVSNENHFEKYKLATMFLEAPIELRYAGNPVTPDKGMKASIGVKIGTLLKAWTKGKDLMNASGTSVYGKTYILKEQYKQYINGTRFAVTARVGYGFFSIDGSYQLTSFLKSSAGAQFNPWSIGITLSGL